MAEIVENLLFPAFGLGLAAVGSLLFGLAAQTVTPERLPKLNALWRNRYLGTALGLLDLLCCAYFLELITPLYVAFLPDGGLWYVLAALFAAASFFYLDYTASRAFSGLAIISGYALVHYPFERMLPGAPIFAVCGWLIGLCGIWGSALPWCWRDCLARCAERPLFRVITAVLSYVLAAALAAALLLLVIK